MEILYAYVDGGYVRNHLRQSGMPDEFDPWKIVQWQDRYLPGSTYGTVDRVFYYDALDRNASTDDATRQEAYLRRVSRLPFTRVETGYIRQTRKLVREQKAVDVQLAVDALEAALYNRARAIILVAGDGDFAPLLDAIRRAGPFVTVVAFAKSLSAELRDAADMVYELPDDFPREWLLAPTSQTIP